MPLALARSVRLALVAAPLLVVACGKSDKAADSSTTTRTDSTSTSATTTTAPADSMAMRHDSTSGTMGGSTGASNDAGILAYTNVANAGEIEEGDLAARKATNAAVKAYGKMIAADHKAMMSEGKALAQKLKITPDSTYGDAKDLQKHTMDDMKDLTDAKAGADWDKKFIDGEIDGHQKVLSKLQDAEKNATNAELKAALGKAATKVQGHLTKAQEIKQKDLKS